jgi:hypothetical protein
MDLMGMKRKALREAWRKQKECTMRALFLFQAFVPKGGGFAEIAGHVPVYSKIV